MRLLTRPRLTALVASIAILGGFGLALLRGEHVSVRIPSKQEWMLRTVGEFPDPPASPAEFVTLGAHLGTPPVIAIVTVGPFLSETLEERAPQTRGTPSPRGQGPTSDYELRIVEVLSSSSLRPGESVVLREPGSRQDSASGDFTPFPHPREGQRLLVALQRSPAHPAGTYSRHPYGVIDVSGPKAHFIDGWRTSVQEMGAPESTPACIEAVRSAVATARP